MEISNRLMTPYGFYVPEGTVILDEVIVRPEHSIPIVSKSTIELLKHFESAHDGDKYRINLQPEMDPVGIWTVGYGHVLTFKGRVLVGERDRALAMGHELSDLTHEQAHELLMDDIEGKYLPEVQKMITRKNLLPHQWGALVAFCYNCGTHYMSKNGKRVPFNLWAHVNGKMPESSLYNYWKTSVTRSKGKMLPGLVRRRKAEAYLFIKGIFLTNPPESI